MHRTSLIAAAAVIVLSSVNAAEHVISKQQDPNQPVNADARASTSEKGEAANRQAIIVSGSARSNVMSGAVVSQSGTRAPAFVPKTPFVFYAARGYIGNDVELQALTRDIQEREQRLLQHPEYRDLLRARERLSLRQMHPDLVAFMQISKEQADQLFELLAEQRVREQSESRPTWPSPGDVAAMQAFVETTQERQRGNEAEIGALLGPDKFQEWKEYEQSTMARFLVQRLQDTLPDDVRLRTEQLRPLVRAIAREQREVFEDRTLVLPQGDIPDEELQKHLQEWQLERMALANQRILDASASILSPRQLEHLGAILQQELEGHSQRQFFFGARAPLSPPVVIAPQR